MARGWPLSILALSPHFWQLWFMSPRILYCLQATARSKHVKCKAIFGDVRQYMRAPTKHLKNLLNTILNGRCCLHLEWGFGDTSPYQCALHFKHCETLLTCMVGRGFFIVVFSCLPLTLCTWNWFSQGRKTRPWDGHGTEGGLCLCSLINTWHRSS